MFSPLDDKQKIYVKNAVALRPRRGFLLRRPREIASVDKIPASSRTPLLADLAVDKTIDRLLLSKKNSVALLVNEGLELLEVRGNAGAFLRLPEGRVSFHLLNLIPDTGLFLEMEKLIRQAKESEEVTSKALVQYDCDHGICEMNIEVTPLTETAAAAFSWSC